MFSQWCSWRLQKCIAAVDYFFLRTSKELAMKSRRGKARRISAASLPGFEFVLTIFSLLASSISGFLLPAASPETQVSLFGVTCGENERTLQTTNKPSHLVNLESIHESSHTPPVLKHKFISSTMSIHATKAHYPGCAPKQIWFLLPLAPVCKWHEPCALTTTYCRARAIQRRRKNGDPRGPTSALYTGSFFPTGQFQ